MEGADAVILFDVDVVGGEPAEIDAREGLAVNDHQQLVPGENVGEDGARFPALDHSVEGVDDGFETMELLDFLDDLTVGDVSRRPPRQELFQGLGEAALRDSSKRDHGERAQQERRDGERHGGGDVASGSPGFQVFRDHCSFSPRCPRMTTKNCGLRGRVMPLHRLIYALVFFAGSLLSGFGQTPEPAPAPQNSTYTLDVGTRLVIEDVSVTDGKGNPVTGLPQSAFHVHDNKEKQTIRDFAESSGSAVIAPGMRARGSYSNEAVYCESGTSTAMLIDPTDMALPDQMYLRLQLLKSLMAQVSCCWPWGTSAPIGWGRCNSR